MRGRICGRALAYLLDFGTDVMKIFGSDETKYSDKEARRFVIKLKTALLQCTELLQNGTFSY